MTTLGQVSRRRFLTRAGALAAGSFAIPHLIPRGVLAAPGEPGANDRIVIGFIGAGGRANQLMDQVPPPGQIVAVADCYPSPGERRRPRPGRQVGRLPGLPQDARSQGHRRRGRRHARPRPGVRLHPRLPGRQGRLRREAADGHHRRGPRAGQRRAQARARLPGRLAAAVDGDEPIRLRVGPQRRHRQGPRGPGRQLHRPGRLHGPARGTDPRGARLGRVVQPDRTAAVQQAHFSSAGWAGATTRAAR